MASVAGAFLGASAAKGDQLSLGHVLQRRLANVFFQTPQHVLLGAAKGPSYLGKIVEVKVDQVAEGLGVAPHALRRLFPAVDVPRGLDRPIVSIGFAQEGL